MKSLTETNPKKPIFIKELLEIPTPVEDIIETICLQLTPE